MSKKKQESIKYHRTPAESGPPFGWADLPCRVAPDAPPGSYEARRLLCWRESHPRDVSVRPAFTGSLPECEVGLRVAVDAAAGDSEAARLAATPPEPAQRTLL